MRRRTNPLVVPGMIVVVIVAFVIGFVVKRLLPEGAGSWKNLIFWMVVTGIDFGGGLAVGKCFGKGRRRP